VLFTRKDQLCELRLDGKIISEAEGPDDLLPKVEMMLRISAQSLLAQMATT
jgi:hypothetical protein